MHLVLEILESTDEPDRIPVFKEPAIHKCGCFGCLLICNKLPQNTVAEHNNLLLF
jgi:hypothetical protein